MRRAVPPIYHLLWTFPLGTVVLLGVVVYVCGAHEGTRNPGGWWPVVGVAAGLSLLQVAVLIVVIRRMRRRYVRHHRRAGDHRRRVRERLVAVRSQARQLAIEDPMTGLYNKAFMERQLTAEFERTRRYGQPLSCAMLDGDFFKRVNDLYGHPVGDDAIREIAAVLRRHARQSDLLGHFGGDEFVLLMPNTPLAAAGLLGERIRGILDDRSRHIAEDHVVTTCSIGIACTTGEDIKTADELLRHADRALYEAKRRGRNRVCLWEPDGIHDYLPANSGR